ncbi:hypothetical protein BH11PLA2_BH11PLA2_43410 [soil metagenome]
MPEQDPNWPETFRSQLLRFGQQLLRTQFQGKLDVEGIVQRTLYEASLVLPPSPYPAAQEAWLKAVFRHNFLDEIRKLTARKRDVQREVPLGSIEVEQKDDSPNRKAVKAEELRAMLFFLSELPADQQAVAEARYLDGLGVEEIATKLGKSRPSIAGLLRRALITLRAKLRAQRSSMDTPFPE